jgi:sporulation protein YlmC with PRC-barrel domain
VKQYVIEGEQVGTLQDIYVDEEETQLYVMDEKRIYAIDLTAR